MLDYDGMAEDLKILQPYILSNVVGFFSNATLEGPLGEGIVIIMIAALYPPEENKPEYRAFTLDPEIDVQAMRQKILGFQLREDIIEKFKVITANWQDPLLKNGLLGRVAEECREKHLPICVIVMGKSRSDEKSDAAAMYWRSGMSPVVALNLLKQEVRKIFDQPPEVLDHYQANA